MCLMYLLVQKCRERGENVNDEMQNADEVTREVEEVEAPAITLKTQAGRNLLVVMLLGLTSALDFVMSMMSIQVMYYTLGGPSSLYGLCVGIYDLGQLVFTPLLNKWAQKNQRYFMPFLFGILLQIAGNLMYSLIFLIQDDMPQDPNIGWALMIASRLIAGCGSAILNLGSTYITTHTTFDERFNTLGSYRVWQSIARMVGPMAGFVFLGISSDNDLFNFFTVPGWFAWILSTLLLIVFLALFREEGVPLRGLAEDENLESFSFRSADKSPGSLLFGVFINNIVQLLFGFVLWSFTFQLFGFGFAQFKVVDAQYDIWKPYVGLGGGAFLASITWKIVPKLVAIENPELVFGSIGSAAVLLGAIFFFPYLGEDGTEPSALLFAGTAFFGIASSLFFANQEVSYSKQLTHAYKEVGSSVNTFMGWYGAVASFSRFLGPFVTGYILVIQDGSTSPPSDPCQVVNSQCCVSSTDYVNDTCELAGTNVYVPILIALGFLAALMHQWYNRSLLQYAKEANQTTDCSTNDLTQV